MTAAEIKRRNICRSVDRIESFMSDKEFLRLVIASLKKKG